MCFNCGCMMPDDRHDDERNIIMQDLVDAANADQATVEAVWDNMQATMAGVFSGKLKSQIWSPETRQ